MENKELPKKFDRLFSCLLEMPRTISGNAVVDFKAVKDSFSNLDHILFLGDNGNKLKLEDTSVTIEKKDALKIIDICGLKEISNNVWGLKQNSSLSSDV